MKMYCDRWYLYVIMAVFLITSCHQFNQFHKDQNTRSRCVRLPTIKSEYESEQRICVDLPKGGKLSKEITGNDNLHVEYKFTYADSSVFYIRNDVWSISQVNVLNMYNAGVTAYRKDQPLDTLRYAGALEGKYWNESVLGDFTLGYESPSPTMKDSFEKAIRTVVVSGD